MTAPTHISFSLVTYFILVGMTGLLGLHPITILFLVLGSLMPDIDTVTSALGRTVYPLASYIEKRWGHRTITHSFVGTAIVGVIVSPLFFWNASYFYALMFGYFSHIFIDCANKQGPMLFWPSSIRGVLPGRKEYRITVSSKPEFILMTFFIVLGVCLYPASSKGFTRSLHLLLGDMRSAVLDYQNLSPDYETFVEVKAVDNLTSERIEGTYKVVGHMGNDVLVLDCSPELRTIGDYGEHNWRPVKVRIVQGKPIRYVLQEVDMSNRLMGDIALFIDKKYKPRIYGSLELVEHVSTPYLMDLYNPITPKGQNLVLKHASLIDIEKFNLANVYVKKGKLLIKTALKKGERLEQINERTAGTLKGAQRHDVVFNIEDRSEVLVKREESVEVGQPMAKIYRKIKALEGMDLEIRNITAQLNIITGKKESLQVITKKNRIDELERNLKMSSKKGKRLVVERIEKIAFLDKRIELLQQQKIWQKKEWEKQNMLKTQLKIDELLAEQDELVSKGDEYPESILERMNRTRRDVNNAQEELSFLVENKNDLEALRLQKRLFDLKVQREDLENKAIIRSRADGIVVAVDYSITQENLTKVRVTVLSNSKKKESNHDRTVLGLLGDRKELFQANN